MDGKISYLNTDLDLTSPHDDLSLIVAAFKARGIYSLHVTRREDGACEATFETEQEHGEPETNIAAMLAAVESFDDSLRAIWLGCTRREFNIGYDCGNEPWAFNQPLSAELLGRMAAACANLRITIYPDRE